MTIFYHASQCPGLKPGDIVLKSDRYNCVFVSPTIHHSEFWLNDKRKYIYQVHVDDASIVKVNTHGFWECDHVRFKSDKESYFKNLNDFTFNISAKECSELLQYYCNEEGLTGCDIEILVYSTVKIGETK